MSRGEPMAPVRRRATMTYSSPHQLLLKGNLCFWRRHFREERCEGLDKIEKSHCVIVTTCYTRIQGDLYDILPLILKLGGASPT